MPLQCEEVQYIYCLYHVDRIDSHSSHCWQKILSLYITHCKWQTAKEKPQIFKTTIPIK